MSTSIIQILKALSIGGAFVLALTIFPPQVFAANVSIEGFTFTSCNEKNCVQIEAQKATGTPLAQVIAFTAAVVKFQLAEGVESDGLYTEEKLEAEDGYYDWATERVVLRGLKHSGHQELVIDLTTGQITRF